jgi:hypothetical protein
MNIKKILGFAGFGLAIAGGYFWMINQIPLSLAVWGLAIIIIIRLNRLKKKAKKKYDNKKKI